MSAGNGLPYFIDIVGVGNNRITEFLYLPINQTSVPTERQL